MTDEYDRDNATDDRLSFDNRLASIHSTPMTTTNMARAIISESGNGFPSKGDYVSDGLDLYLVNTIESYIHTTPSGRGSYVYAEVTEVPWDACPEGDDEHLARVRWVG